MNIWGKILKAFGWSVEIKAPRRKKCVICVAPHTSNWDFIIGLASYRSLGRDVNFLMKRFWFFWPLKYLLKHFGGIPVDTSGHHDPNAPSLTEQIISDFSKRDYLNLAITPEGTRSARSNWKTGFLYIAYGAKVPIQLGTIDFRNKRIIIKDEYEPTGDVEMDMNAIKAYYADCKEGAKYPDKFTVD